MYFFASLKWQSEKERVFGAFSDLGVDAIIAVANSSCRCLSCARWLLTTPFSVQTTYLSVKASEEVRGGFWSYWLCSCVPDSDQLIKLNDNSSNISYQWKCARTRTPKDKGDLCVLVFHFSWAMIKYIFPILSLSSCCVSSSVFSHLILQGVCRFSSFGDHKRKGHSEQCLLYFPTSTCLLVSLPLSAVSFTPSNSTETEAFSTLSFSWKLVLKITHWSRLYLRITMTL